MVPYSAIPLKITFTKVSRSFFTPHSKKNDLFEVILVPDISGIKSGLSSFSHSSKSFINTQMETDQQLLPVC